VHTDNHQAPQHYCPQHWRQPVTNYPTAYHECRWQAAVIDTTTTVLMDVLQANVGQPVAHCSRTEPFRIDWVIVSMSRLTQNRSFRKHSPISWLGMEKLNLTQQKHTFTNQKKCTTTQNTNTKARFSCLLPSYDIRPGNGESIFCFWRLINLSLYLLT